MPPPAPDSSALDRRALDTLRLYVTRFPAAGFATVRGPGARLARQVGTLPRRYALGYLVALDVVPALVELAESRGLTVILRDEAGATLEATD